MTPKLYIVPTPIGNLEDMTFRAIKVLNSVDLILAEDTRNTIHLLRHFQIEKPLRSYHAHNEHKTVEQIVEMKTSTVFLRVLPPTLRITGPAMEFLGLQKIPEPTKPSTEERLW